MSTIEKWLAGVTIVAVVATLVSSPYTASILSAGSTGIANVYSAAKH